MPKVLTPQEREQFHNNFSTLAQRRLAGIREQADLVRLILVQTSRYDFSFEDKRQMVNALQINKIAFRRAFTIWHAPVSSGGAEPEPDNISAMEDGFAFEKENFDADADPKRIDGHRLMNRRLSQLMHQIKVLANLSRMPSSSYRYSPDEAHALISAVDAIIDTIKVMIDPFQEADKRIRQFFELTANQKDDEDTAH